jgi:hypothetical protein
MSHRLPSASVLDHFSALSDPRQRWRVLYPLPEILLLVLCATFSGMEDFVEIRLWDFLPPRRIQDRSTPMSEKPISPLRRRMIEDMTVRNSSRRRATTISGTLGRSQPSSAGRQIRPSRRKQRPLSQYERSRGRRGRSERHRIFRQGDYDGHDIARQRMTCTRRPDWWRINEQISSPQVHLK